MTENQDNSQNEKKKNWKKIIPFMLIGIVTCCIVSVVVGAVSDVFSIDDVAEIQEVVSPTKQVSSTKSDDTPMPADTIQPVYGGLEYILHNDRSYSDAGTFKVMWDILIDPERKEITEYNLEELLNHLYQEAYVLVPEDDRPKVIAVYVYTSEEYLLTGGQWIGMANKSGVASEPSISINERQLENLYAVPEEKLGFTEDERIQIWNDIVHAEDRATAEADTAYPDMDPVDEYLDLLEELELKYKTELANGVGLTIDQLQEISLEGLQKDWPLPTPISK